MWDETHHWRYGIEADLNSGKRSGRCLCVYCSDDLSVNPEYINDGDEDLYCERCLLKTFDVQKNGREIRVIHPEARIRIAL